MYYLVISLLVYLLQDSCLGIEQVSKAVGYSRRKWDEEKETQHLVRETVLTWSGCSIRKGKGKEEDRKYVP